MTNQTNTKYNKNVDALYEEGTGVPALLWVYSVCDRFEDRFLLPEKFQVGHSTKCNLMIEDKFLSRQHFIISRKESRWYIEDLESKNGTVFNGNKIKGKTELLDNSVIVAGDNIFVFNSQTTIDVFNSSVDKYGMVGGFHTERVIYDLAAAAKSSYPLLLVGPSGCGKELAARAYAKIVNRRKKEAPFKIVHAGRFANEEQAMTGLFGVQKGIFSGVDFQTGTIKSAEGGVLYLDEIHRLFKLAQVGLLRVIENRDLSSIGSESINAKTTVRFVFASNSSDENCGLVPDFFARLRVVWLSPLSERIADIPELFDHFLKHSFEEYDVALNEQKRIRRALLTDHYELMCLFAFQNDNVRGIIKLCDEIVSKYKTGGNAAKLVNDAFSRLLGDFDGYKQRVQERSRKRGSRTKRITTTEGHNRMSSKMYDEHQTLIMRVYRVECNCSFIKTVEVLNQKYNITVNRNTLSKKIKFWG